MLDDIIIRSIIKRERERQKGEWQPEPLYLPIDDYEPPLPAEDDEDKEQEERGIIIIEMGKYKPNTSYSQ